MPVPMTPRLDFYRGSNNEKRRKVDEKNAQAWEILKCLQKMIVKDEDEMQQYRWSTIAFKLGIEKDDVARATPGGGHYGITLRVTSDDRREINRVNSNFGKL